jgi:hypothetical protein
VSLALLVSLSATRVPGERGRDAVEWAVLEDRFRRAHHEGDGEGGGGGGEGDDAGGVEGALVPRERALGGDAAEDLGELAVAGGEAQGGDAGGGGVGAAVDGLEQGVHAPAVAAGPEVAAVAVHRGRVQAIGDGELGVLVALEAAVARGGVGVVVGLAVGVVVAVVVAVEEHGFRWR